MRGIGVLERGRRAAPQRRTVAALADGLGLDEALRQRLLTAARAGRTGGYSPVGVRAFPRGVDDFVGRERELARLAALATHEVIARPGGPQAVVGPVAGYVSVTPHAGGTPGPLWAGRAVVSRAGAGGRVSRLLPVGGGVSGGRRRDGGRGHRHGPRTRRR